MLHSLVALLALLAVPVHGTALGPGPNHTTIVRVDGVTGMLDGQTREFDLSPALRLRVGTGVDAFLDRSRTPWRLYDASVAAPFIAGMPNGGTTFPLDLGSTLPHTKLVDQDGHLVDLASSFARKVTLISFVFTRCPDKDECPAISSKFAYMQQHLNPAHFHLVEITLDPSYDSPFVLHGYAKQFGADAGTWSIVTGQGHEVQYLLNRFGISSLRVSDANFVHNDKVFVVGTNGKIAQIVQTVGFDPADLVAQARHLAGMSSDPILRIKLAMIASVVALCGGSQLAGVVLLETMLFLVIAVASFGTLFWVARHIFWKRA